MCLFKCVTGLYMTWFSRGRNISLVFGTTLAACSHKCNSLPSPYPCLHVFLYEPSPTFTPPNPTSSNNAKMKEVPTFAALRQFRVAEQVTCHNSGKSLWLDLQANSWHGMVEWQRLRLTLSTQQLHHHSSAWIGGGFTQGPEARKPQVSSLYPSYFRLLSHIGCRLQPPPRRLSQVEASR